METQINYAKPRPLNVYMQQALRPISKRYWYPSYVNELPLRQNDKVLEFGSGVGAMAELLAKKLNEGQLTCIDISNKYLSVAQRNLKDYPNVSFLKGRLVDVELNDNDFDAVNIHFVLHDIPASNRSVVLNQMFEILRPGGKVFIREPLKKSHGMSVDEIKILFKDTGFCPLFQKEEKVKVFGEVFTACYAKVSTIGFFFS